MAYNIIPQRGVFSTIANLINENFQRIYQQILGLDGSGEQTAEDISQLESDVSALQAGKANDADVVHKAGAETITGNKTFTGTVKLMTQNMEGGILSRRNDGIVEGVGVGADILRYEDANSDEFSVGIGDTVEECITNLDSALGHSIKVFGCPSYAGGATVVTYNGVETALSNMGGFKTNIVLQYVSISVKVMMRYTGVNPTGNYSFGATQFDHNDGKVYVYGAEVTDTDSVYVYRSELNGTQIL